MAVPTTNFKPRSALRLAPLARVLFTLWWPTCLCLPGPRAFTVLPCAALAGVEVICAGLCMLRIEFYGAVMIQPVLPVLLLSKPC